MNGQQIEWAKRHDWFLESDWVNPETRCVVVIDRYQTVSGTTASRSRVFTDYSDLREWAGY